MKRGLRFVRGGEKELVEKLGRADPCPCGSGKSFQALLPRHRPVSTGRSGTTTGVSEGRGSRPVLERDRPEIATSGYPRSGNSSLSSCPFVPSRLLSKKAWHAGSEQAPDPRIMSDAGLALGRAHRPCIGRVVTRFQGRHEGAKGQGRRRGCRGWRLRTRRGASAQARAFR